MAHILLIDDEPTVRRYFGRVLEMAGHRVALAENGKEGIRLFEANRPDLVITDILMPESDGIETINILRRDHPDVKIIAISGGGTAPAGGYLRAAEMLGANMVMEKPIRAAQLRDAIDQLLGS